MKPNDSQTSPAEFAAQEIRKLLPTRHTFTQLQFDQTIAAIIQKHFPQSSRLAQAERQIASANQSADFWQRKYEKAEKVIRELVSAYVSADFHTRIPAALTAARQFMESTTVEGS